MFLGLVRRLDQELGVPIVVAVQGEDLFLDALPQTSREAVLKEMRRRAGDATAFIAPSRYYATHMASILGVAIDRMHVVPLGIQLGGHRPPSAAALPSRDSTTIGFLARISPEKGLHVAVEALGDLVPRFDGEISFKVAGYLGAKDRPYFEKVKRRVRDLGLDSRFEHVGELDRDGKIRFLQSLDVLTVPTVYAEPKGLFVLEALANRVPVVVPRHGSFPEMIAATQGGVLVEPNSPQSLADALHGLLTDHQRLQTLGRQGQAVVHERFNDAEMARATADLYAKLLGQAPTSVGPHHRPPVAPTEEAI